MHKNHEPGENVLFFLFTWLPFQIVFFSAHQCKETNYDQTENIEFINLEVENIFLKKKSPCNKEQKEIDIVKKHQRKPEKMQRFAQNH